MLIIESTRDVTDGSHGINLVVADDDAVTACSRLYVDHTLLMWSTVSTSSSVTNPNVGVPQNVLVLGKCHLA